MRAPTASPGEFYQLDFEMSFVTQDDVFNAIEPVLAGLFAEFANGKSVTAAGDFPRIPYREAMLKYGSDKPDLRNPLIVHDVGAHFVGSGFGLFAGLVDKGMVVRAVAAPNTADKSRKFFDEMNDWARGEGFAGLGYATRKGGEWGGPIAKNHGVEGMDKIAAGDGAGPRRRHLLRRGQGSRSRQARRRGADARRGEPRPDREGRVPLLLDRRLPDVRI